ncbi:hypothetical protein RU86_GL000532 [Lactococcus piscium]|uniref:GTP cyclohydrolase 1 type 2 homolog n=1 Tax=Pseudolactococcus piscium TaxID=1364 RepID=A0A2A5RWZ9_9LACT|nr:hypothetical protein RU86_GL000532 [Lactococcus piscium]
MAKKADVYVTRDIYYHTAHDMLYSGLTAIDPGHHIEVLFIKKVTQVFRDLKIDVTIIESRALTILLSVIKRPKISYYKSLKIRYCILGLFCF